MPTHKFTVYPYPKQINPKMKNLTGERHGKLLVIGFAGIAPKGKTMWHCLCDCGNGRTYDRRDLVQTTLVSCGCHRIQKSKERVKHGECVDGKISPEYRIYQGAKERCNNPRARNYKTWGGRGIQFLFQSFEEFLNHVGRRPTKDHSLDRIDNNGHYAPNNVRWATTKEQAQNRDTTRWITINGITKCVSDWAKQYNQTPTTIGNRIKRGWCDSCAVLIPPNKGIKHTDCCLSSHSNTLTNYPLP